MKGRNEIISFLANEKVEHLYIFNEDVQLFHAIGEKDKVAMENSFLWLIKNNSIIHNHPENSPPSISDIINTVCNKAKELILITPSYTYKFQTNNIYVLDTELNDTILKINKLANEEIDKLLMKGIIEITEANFEKSHYIWVIIANYYGFYYERRKN